MAYKEKTSLNAETTAHIGGTNKTTGKPNPTKIEGYFLGTKETVSDYGPGKLHVFQTASGNVAVWGKSNSNRLLTKDLIGQMVELTFTGMGKPAKGRQPAYEYKVRHDEDNLIDVAEPAAEETEAEPEHEEQDLYESERFDEEPSFSAPVRKGTLSTPSAERQAQTAKLLSGRK